MITFDATFDANSGARVGRIELVPLPNPGYVNLTVVNAQGEGVAVRIDPHTTQALAAVLQTLGTRVTP